MKRLLNKQSARQLSLLELLWENEWLTVSEIVKEIGGGEKTIRTDIKQLNEIIEPLKIETSYKYGVYLNKDLGISKAYLYSLFLQKSVECQMLETIFIDSEISKGELCDQLFISETQLNRLHKKLNIFLKKYDIRITNNLKIIGNERNIRKFFSSLIYEKYLTPDFFFKKEEFKLIDTVLNKFYTQNKSQLITEDHYHFLLNKLRMRIWVAAYRCKAGAFFQQEKSYFCYSMITEDENLKKQWQSIFGITLSDKILYNLFEYFHAPIDLSKKWFQMGVSQATLKIRLEKMISTIRKELTIDCWNQAILIQAILWNSFRAIGPTFILNNVEEDFVLELMKERQDIVLSIKEKLAVVYEGISLHSSDKNNIFYQSIYTLVSQWPDLRAEIRKPMVKIKAALLLDVSSGHLKMLKEEIEYHFRNIYEVDILPPLKQTSFNQLVFYDCVLTNGFNSDELGDVEIIGVPNYFGEEFIKKLHHFLINKKEELKLFRKNVLIQ
ncbi:helix-turn-helix domain-containing protein [Enterococcus ratti]|uniref:Transcriptional antiterminator n=1 Tax=Enterococcus ratti TaxID=150033 RepID=A0A1L8WLH0_9ENTE|nr:helix-turn-helix domain-containing protein [Enterococcus ratti]OJG81864.1 hypothetical protein RV14_GL002407 [Enterococcus ratti]